jgi:hypothetical protein
LALSDVDDTVQSEAINALSNLLESDGTQAVVNRQSLSQCTDTSLTGGYHQSIVSVIHEHVESGVEDTENLVRLAWIKLASSQIKDGRDYTIQYRLYPH